MQIKYVGPIEEGVVSGEGDEGPYYFGVGVPTTVSARFLDYGVLESDYFEAADAEAAAYVPNPVYNRVPVWFRPPGKFERDDGTEILVASSDADLLGSGVLPEPHLLASRVAGGSDNARLAAAVTLAAGRDVVLDRDFYVSNLGFANQDISIKGPGRILIAAGSSGITVERTLSDPRDVSSMSDVLTGPALSGVTDVATRLDVAPSALADIGQGDLLLVTTQDSYATTSLAPGTAYKSQWCPVAGVARSFVSILNGGPVEGNTLVGATSGATAQVLSSATQDDGTVIALFGARTGSFSSGETVTVGGQTRGTVSGPAFIVSGTRLAEHYSSTVQIRKHQAPSARCSIACDIVTDGDSDALVGTAQRKVALDLRGVCDPQIKVGVRSSWTRAISLSSCYGGNVDAHIFKAPNSADLTEQAYGYGVEIFGSTEYTDVVVNGRNLRHCFTTNPGQAADWAQASSLPLRAGTAKFITVHDSKGWGTFGATFDTHAHALFVSFVDCHSYSGNAAGRVITPPVAFQNRSFGTTYTDCTAVGPVIGFSCIADLVEAPFANRVSYNGCSAVGYQRYGFAQLVAHTARADALTQHRYNGCEAFGDPTITTATQYQIGFSAHGGDMTYKGCTSGCFNGAPWRFDERARVTLQDCLLDYSQSDPFTSTGIRAEGPPAMLSLKGCAIQVHPDYPVNVGGAVRVVMGLFGGASKATLSAGLSTSSATTSLPVAALADRITKDSEITLVSGSSYQVWKLTATAVAGATSLAVVSQTPNFAYPSASVLAAQPNCEIHFDSIETLGGTLPRPIAATQAGQGTFTLVNTSRGSLTKNVASVGVSYSATPGDDAVHVTNTLTTDITVTLPLAAQVGKGAEVEIKDVGGGAGGRAIQGACQGPDRFESGAATQTAVGSNFGRRVYRSDGVDRWLDAGGASGVATVISQTSGSYTLAASDGEIIREHALGTAITVTVPTNASVPIPVGKEFRLVNVFTGSVTVAGASGVTVNGLGLTLAQYQSGVLRKRATDTWIFTRSA